MQVLATKPAFADYMSNPTVSRDEKVKAIDELFSGPKTSKVMKNLMSTLAGNNRVTEADKVADAYLELMKVRLRATISRCMWCSSAAQLPA